MLMGACAVLYRMALGSDGVGVRCVYDVGFLRMLDVAWLMALLMRRVAVLCGVRILDAIVGWGVVGMCNDAMGDVDDCAGKVAPLSYESCTDRDMLLYERRGCGECGRHSDATVC